ncbi:MAG: TetR/AcrR family transcriptional regulator C-terminal domain-containing protein [Jiangellales bacterium]
MTTSTTPTRPPLSAERVLDAAVRIADRRGIEAFTIRRLADELGVKPMTIYHHVPNKDAIIDGMVDRVFAEIDLPPADQHWKAAMRHKCMSARDVMLRHPWAPPLMESRTTPGPATLLHHDTVLGCLLGGGLSFELVAHAGAVLDSYVYGFTMQETHLPFGGGEQIGELAEAIIEAMPADGYPNMVAFTVNHVLKPGYNFSTSFEFGLDVLLDGLETAAARD